MERERESKGFEDRINQDERERDREKDHISTKKRLKNAPSAKGRNINFLNGNCVAVDQFRSGNLAVVDQFQEGP